MRFDLPTASRPWREAKRPWGWPALPLGATPTTKEEQSRCTPHNRQLIH